MPGRKQSRCYEEISAVIDIAGIAQMDDMDANADVQPRAPQWAHGIEEIAVSASCNGDALGSGVAFLILSGNAFTNGPHAIPIAGYGGEVVIERSDGVAATVLHDLGIKVTPGGEYILQIETVGEDGGEVGAIVELIFQAAAVRKPKQWIPREEQVAAVDADIAMATLAQVAAPVDAGPSNLIDGVIIAMGSDLAALGCCSGVVKISQGTVDEQHINAGSWGGELIVGDGDVVPPSQRVDAGYALKGGEPIVVEARMVNEDGGTISIGVSLGVAR